MAFIYKIDCINFIPHEKVLCYQQYLENLGCIIRNMYC